LKSCGNISKIIITPPHDSIGINCVSLPTAGILTGVSLNGANRVLKKAISLRDISDDASEYIQKLKTRFF